MINHVEFKVAEIIIIDFINNPKIVLINEFSS